MVRNQILIRFEGIEGHTASFGEGSMTRHQLVVEYTVERARPILEEVAAGGLIRPAAIGLEEDKKLVVVQHPATFDSLLVYAQIGY